jgi:hypothetical protein
MRWLLLLLSPITAFAETVTIRWQDVLDANTLGYRVYEYRDDSKILRYEGIDTQYIQVIEESTVFGVASFNEYSESQVIPRAVILEKPEPARVSWTITVESN